MPCVGQTAGGDGCKIGDVGCAIPMKGKLPPSWGQCTHRSRVKIKKVRAAHPTLGGAAGIAPALPATATPTD